MKAFRVWSAARLFPKWKKLYASFPWTERRSKRTDSPPIWMQSVLHAMPAMPTRSSTSSVIAGGGRMREESQLDEWLLLKAAPYTDWHVDIDKPETSVVFLSENEAGEALVHAQPMRVPEPLRPLLFHLIERLQAHVSAGDPHSFAIDLGSMRFRGERLRPARYALRRTQQRVESLKALRLGAGAEQLLLDPEFCSGGLILISGEHGAGKSTTARATVVDRLKTYGGYCLTVESPV